jgi:hypothetical protein
MLLQNFAQSPTASSGAPIEFARPKAHGRKRGMVSGFAGMASALALVVGAELLLPDAMKPSTLLGGMTGHSEAVLLATKLKATQATVAAQMTEQARMQNQINDYQMKLNLLQGYYQVSYQRLGSLAQAASNVEQQFMEQRNQLAAQSQAGNVGLANFGSVIAALGMVTGNQKLAQAGQIASDGFRQEALNNVDDAMKQGMAKAGDNITAWNQGLPDMQQLTQLLNQPPGHPMPAPAAPPPPPPAIYAPAGTAVQ